MVGIGIGGCKDTTMRIAKEAACLRAVGDRNPDPQIAELEEELKELGNSIGMGPMGFVGSQMVVDCLLYTSPSPRDGLLSRMPSSA